MKELVLIDGDLVCYPCAASAKGLPREIAEVRCDELIRRIIMETNAVSYKLYIGGEDNFRYNIWSEYKAHRKTMEKPEWLDACREHVMRYWNATIVNGMETDDKLGIELTSTGVEAILASFDKDMLQIPGWHYNWKKQEHRFVSPYDGLRTFYKQLIAGDGADNIPSYDGKFRNTVPKFIERLQQPLDEMTEELDMYNYVTSIWEDGDTLNRNASLLYILKEEGNMWQPPGQKEGSTGSL